MNNTDMCTCVICGKEFVPTRRSGRKANLCSDECRKKRRSQQSVRYMQKRYYSDEEYRKYRSNSMTESNRRRRTERKEKIFNEVVEDVFNAKDIETVRSILQEKMKVKAELYAKAL